MIALNTTFQKPNTKLITYRAPTLNWGPPGTRHRYETLDYCLIQDRWKNAAKDSESDVTANIDSDHFPLKTTFKFKLKVEPTKKKNNRNKYLICNEAQQTSPNTQLKTIMNRAKSTTETNKRTRAH